MEIYSPKSKSKSLFKQNQLKVSEISNGASESLVENKEYFSSVKLVRKKDSSLIKFKNMVTKYVSDFFEMDEVV